MTTVFNPLWQKHLQAPMGRGSTCTALLFQHCHPKLKGFFMSEFLFLVYVLMPSGIAQFVGFIDYL